MPKLTKPRTTQTPTIRRFLRSVLKPAASALGKRNRDAPDARAAPPNPLAPSLTRTHASSALPTTPPPRACVALQNACPDNADAVIITSLPAVPFCCHADLASMPRAELRAVARALNARLPAALRIPPGADADVRRAIEHLVGLRDAPAPPRRARSVSFDGAREEPVSPLANKSRASLEGTPLARLQEESDEEEEDRGEGMLSRMRLEEDGPRKRRRTDTAPRRITRAQAQRVARALQAAAESPTMVRAQTQPAMVPAGMARVMTSTPKRRARTVQSPRGAGAGQGPPRFRSLLAGMEGAYDGGSGEVTFGIEGDLIMGIASPERSTFSGMDVSMG